MKASKLQENIHEEEETEYISKEEVLAGIRSGLQDLKMVREGKLKPISFDEFIKELEDECK